MQSVIQISEVLKAQGGLAAIRMPGGGRYPFKVVRPTKSGFMPVSRGYSTETEVLADLGLRTGLRA